MMSMRTIALALAALGLVRAASAGDWPSWRGPEQNGLLRAEAPVTAWSQEGQDLLWKVPIGGRSTPIYLNKRLYLIAPAGDGPTLGERVVCLDPDTGKTIWEHRFNVFHTDIVRDRLGWTSVVGDPETGNIYAHGTGGELFCFNADGELLWSHSLTEEYGRSSGYGGRLHTPIVDEDRVVISFTYILSTWGSGKKKAAHRYLAFDKRTGELVWIGQPGGRPFNTTYSTPIIRVIDGKRLLIASNADGYVYAMLARTGQRVWSFHLTNRNGLNTSVVSDGKYIYATHSTENVDNSEMGRVVCIDGSGTGDITKTGEVWRADGLKVGYSSPALANGRLYVATNSANLICLDATTGERHWVHDLGRVMKGSPVVTADGVIYAGSVNGRFSILNDGGDAAEVLDAEQFSRPDGLVVEINGSVAIADGRVFFMTSDYTYCLASGSAAPTLPPPPDGEEAPAGQATTLQIRPAEVTLEPGAAQSFAAVLFDANGRYVGTASDVDWTVPTAPGRIESPGRFVADAANAFSAGLLSAEAAGLSAEARVRVTPRLPIVESFDGMKPGTRPPGWIGLDAKTKIVDYDGARVLKKLALKPSAKYARMRSFSGPPLPAGYTVQADLMALPRPGRRPVLSDMGLINCRYKLILLGYEKNVRLVSYSPIPRVQVDVPFDWHESTWYRAKLSVDVVGGKGMVRGKVWPRGEPEPDGWTIELTDPAPNLEGSPGLYAFSKGTRPAKPGSPVFFDNYQVTSHD